MATSKNRSTWLFLSGAVLIALLLFLSGCTTYERSETINADGSKTKTKVPAALVDAREQRALATTVVSSMCADLGGDDITALITNENVTEAGEVALANALSIREIRKMTCASYMPYVAKATAPRMSMAEYDLGSKKLVYGFAGQALAAGPAYAAMFGVGAYGGGGGKGNIEQTYNIEGGIHGSNSGSLAPSGEGGSSAGAGRSMRIGVGNIATNMGDEGAASFMSTVRQLRGDGSVSNEGEKPINIGTGQPESSLDGSQTAPIVDFQDNDEIKNGISPF